PLDLSTLSTEMRHSFNDVKAGIAEIQTNVSNINSKLDHSSQRLDSAEWPIKDHVYHVENLTVEIHSLREKCNDLENRALRSNLRIVGIPKGTEGRDPIALHLKVLGEDTFPGRVESERVHQALKQCLRLGKHPHITIVKFLRFQDKSRALLENQLIFFFPNINTELYAKRREFTRARKLCHSLKTPFALLHPTRLRISVDQGVKFF
uniref:L1 transposable element RRM domain-containing protein n=1 Tax=Latimeria chalumnae TaxID=7897 RepID=H3B5M7_LATCH